MASHLPKSAEQALLKDVILLLWGPSLKEDVFSRWTQGFVFSEKTNTALVQLQGGPCAIIAPVQAFIVKCALFKGGNCSIDALTSVSAERANQLLIEALYEILSQLNSSQYILVSLSKHLPSVESQLSAEQLKCEENGETSTPSIQDESNNTKRALTALNQESFHANLKFHHCSDTDELHRSLEKSLPAFQSKFGVLLYLYSLVLSKGVRQIKNEVEDPSEPLIDGIYGHGSQSLINLLLTSQATSYVWDNDKDISGLKLRGLEKQSTIGFLSLLEHLRYCEVGWFYKNPKYPIWLLGSETHLTVLFSTNENLVVKDNPSINARHVFSQFDSEGNGFISSSVLEEVMKLLDLVADKEYVDIMREKMDSEHLGIITRNSFMEEFFPEEPPEQPRSFHLYHYNGIPHSCPDGKVTFVEAYAILDEEVETQFITDTSPIKLCLQTKWPSIELTWTNKLTPSLN
ncbi:protein FAM188A [Biomphalaria pfeifferi]|uniref:Ubiquitin carboxyl-terminal hydrolase MINDY n=1 Tax=Biomphalaria pfeifferi TaxID=112525 RepID=A0AAD8BIT5_BIOPF|nr:protein FAM188A [Biomphalaria pfeifferi]